VSGVGNGYLTGNMQIAFPFEDDQCLPWGHDERLRLQQALQKCFVDASVSLADHSIPEDGWPAIGSFSVADNTLGCALSVGDDIVQVSIRADGDRFPILYGKRPWGAYILVAAAEGAAEFVSLCNELAISPPAPTQTSSTGRDGAFWLRLCPKCVNVRPVSLTSIRVFDGVDAKDGGPHFVLTGDVVVRPGNNMQLAEPDDMENGIELNATPGAGLGRVACVCAETAGGNAALAGPDGGARLFNDTCYDLEVGEKYINEDGLETQDLKIHVKCTACCTCAMYESIVNDRLVQLANIVREAKRRIGELHQSYESAVQRFNTRLVRPTLSDVTLTLSGMPIGANVSPKIGNNMVSGKMSRCAFSALVRNSSFSALMVTVTGMSGTDSIVEAIAAWTNEPGEPQETVSDSAGGVVGKTYTIYPGRSLSVTYVSEKNAQVSQVSTGGFSGKFAVAIAYRSPDGTTRSIGVLRKDVQV
jgi:hypothetical protein